MTQCAISLGGNLGNVTETFARACNLLSEQNSISDLKISRHYCTTPMGVSAGNYFLNAAATFETTFDAQSLLDQLQKIEADCGRVRTSHWGPRTLDLDLLLFGPERIASSRLIVPHPGLWYRRFVLDPLTDVCPAISHPIFNLSMKDLRQRLMSRPLPIVINGVDPNRIRDLPELKDCVILDAESDAQQAAIVFEANFDGPHLAQTIRLPKSSTATQQLIRDVLTAALDEPVIVD